MDYFRNMKLFHAVQATLETIYFTFQIFSPIIRADPVFLHPTSNPSEV